MVVLLTSICCLYALNAIASSDKSSESNKDIESQAYRFFQVGAAIKTYTSLFSTTDTYTTELEVLKIRVGVKWENGIFANFGSFGTRGNGVGYNFYDYGDWEFDALVHSGINAIEVGSEPFIDDFRFGLRATHYSDDSFFRIIASPINISEGTEGVYVGSWYVKSWQIKNWNIHGLTGASYFSSDILDDRYSGIFLRQTTASETPTIEVYNPGNGVVLEFEVGATYALSRNWIFEASAGQTVVSDAIFDNPLVDNRGQTYANLGVFYVF